MFHRDRIPPSQCFQHVCRALRPGESIPPLPSLMQQIEAYQVDLVRFAEAEAEAEAEAVDEEPWDDEDDLDLDEAA